MSVKIIVNIFYKPNKFLEKLIQLDEGRLYFPINGGSSLKEKYKNQNWLHFDDIGNNISIHNHALNEMTSIYWFWKNYNWKNIDYIGFNHYRRLFHPKMLKDYKKYDAIVAKPFNFIEDLETQYFISHNENDLSKLVGILSTFFNDGKLFAKYMLTKSLYAPCNMFVMKKNLFDQYCNFMFPILFRLLDSIKLDEDKYQHRAIAFLSERLTSFWFKQLYKIIKIKEIDLEFIDGK